MARKRMYFPGRKLTMRGLTDALMRQEYVCLFGQPIHPAFIGNMHFWTLVYFIRRGAIRKAVRNA